MTTVRTLQDAVRDAWASIPAPPADDLKYVAWGWGEEAWQAFVNVAPMDVDIDSAGFNAVDNLLELPRRAAAAYLGTYALSLLRNLEKQAVSGVYTDIVTGAHARTCLALPDFMEDIVPFLPPKCREVLVQIIAFLTSEGREALALRPEDVAKMMASARVLNRLEKSGPQRMTAYWLQDAVRDAWASIPAPPADDLKYMVWGWGEEAWQAFVNVAPMDVNIDSIGFNAADPLLNLPRRAAAAYLGPYLLSLLRGVQMQMIVGIFHDITTRAHTLACLTIPHFWEDIKPFLPPKCREVLVQVVAFLTSEGREALALDQEDVDIMRAEAAKFSKSG